MALVRARDPILFYDDVLLYESELDDHGCAQLSVKACPSSGSISERYWQAASCFWTRLACIMEPKRVLG